MLEYDRLSGISFAHETKTEFGRKYYTVEYIAGPVQHDRNSLADATGFCTSFITGRKCRMPLGMLTHSQLINDLHILPTPSSENRSMGCLVSQTDSWMKVWNHIYWVTCIELNVGVKHVLISHRFWWHSWSTYFIDVYKVFLTERQHKLRYPGKQSLLAAVNISLCMSTCWFIAITRENML